jgi:hypothetical protein
LVARTVSAFGSVGRSSGRENCHLTAILKVKTMSRNAGDKNSSRNLQAREAAKRALTMTGPARGVDD